MVPFEGQRKQFAAAVGRSRAGAATVASVMRCDGNDRFWPLAALRFRIFLID